jgi:hypothetical protein
MQVVGFPGASQLGKPGGADAAAAVASRASRLTHAPYSFLICVLAVCPAGLSLMQHASGRNAFLEPANWK